MVRGHNIIKLINNVLIKGKGSDAFSQFYKIIFVINKNHRHLDHQVQAEHC